MVNKMKKMIYVLVISLLSLAIFSCAKKDDTSSTTTTTSFAPPSWIQGAWVDNVSSSTKIGYKFDSSDVYLVIFGNVTAGYVAAGVVTKHLTSTDSEFSYSYPISGTSGETSFSGTVTLAFTKETTSTIGLTGNSTTSYISVVEGTFTKDTSL